MVFSAFQTSNLKMTMPDAQGFYPAGDPEWWTEAVPRLLWIELTSTCPFHCVFCSRELRHGHGGHMEWRLFQTLMEQLDAPEILRLNYSGESIHYPHLIEAIRLAKATGAWVELVSAFSSISSDTIRGLVDSGLDRLSLSLHTLDPAQYSALYGFSSLDRFLNGFHELKSYQEETQGNALRSSQSIKNAPIHGELRPGALEKDLKKRKTPHIDLAFVALRENLPQLSAIAEFASQNQISEIFVHPVLWREAAPSPFPLEIHNGHLTGKFKSDLIRMVDEAKRHHPEVDIKICNPEIMDHAAPFHGNKYDSPSSDFRREGWTCEQNPWETAHVLANGDLVACEVNDKNSLGNLREQSLKEIWHGEGYREFRRRFQRGEIEECGRCPWRTPYDQPESKFVLGAAGDSSLLLLKGWHLPGEENLIWSKKVGLALLKKRTGCRKLRIQGVLPHKPVWPSNRLWVECNGVKLGEVENRQGTMRNFKCELTLPSSPEDWLYLTFQVDQIYCPSRFGDSLDQRGLGFGLIKMKLL